jgi:hypothetical protein
VLGTPPYGSCQVATDSQEKEEGSFCAHSK